jgi:hypothetical protein
MNKTRNELEEIEKKEIMKDSEKLWEDPIALSLLEIYAKNIELIKEVSKKVNSGNQDPPDKKAS